jgi:hypothetical protein
MLKVAVIGGGSTWFPIRTYGLCRWACRNSIHSMDASPTWSRQALITPILPVIIFFFAQRIFMQGFVFTGVET